METFFSSYSRIRNLASNRFMNRIGKKKSEIYCNFLNEKLIYRKPTTLDTQRERCVRKENQAFHELYPYFRQQCIVAVLFFAKFSFHLALVTMLGFLEKECITWNDT